MVILLALASFSSLSRANDSSSVIEEMNLARTNPQQYASIVEARMQSVPMADPRCVAEATSFLRRQHPLPPLQSASGLMASAQEQVQEQGPQGVIGHRGAGGSTPWSRMSKQGQWVGRAGENISYGYPNARSIVVTLIVDQGVPDRGHRKNIFPGFYRGRDRSRPPRPVRLHVRNRFCRRICGQGRNGGHGFDGRLESPPCI